MYVHISTIHPNFLVLLSPPHESFDQSSLGDRPSLIMKTTVQIKHILFIFKPENMYAPHHFEFLI